jgi:cadmium resistance protein CadD (predicted permease)
VEAEVNMKKSTAIFIGSFVSAMIIEFFATWFFFSEFYTRGGIQGFIGLALWMIGAKVFMSGEDWSKRESAMEMQS